MAAIELRVPSLQGSRVSVCLTECCVPEGGPVRAGEVLCVLECRKTDYEWKVKIGGRVEWLAEEGAHLSPGSPLCRIHEEGPEVLSKYRTDLDAEPVIELDPEPESTRSDLSKSWE
jgi:pyruvate/2-oxoglutarate dehydrogenase complex dihydrolipoamide acyltransferase (E2) component